MCLGAFPFLGCLHSIPYILCIVLFLRPSITIIMMMIISLLIALLLLLFDFHFANLNCWGCPSLSLSPDNIDLDIIDSSTCPRVFLYQEPSHWVAGNPNSLDRN